MDLGKDLKQPVEEKCWQPGELRAGKIFQFQAKKLISNNLIHF